MNIHEKLLLYFFLFPGSIGGNKRRKSEKHSNANQRLSWCQRGVQLASECMISWYIKRVYVVGN